METTSTGAPASNTLSEQPVQFGAERHLVGVLTNPKVAIGHEYALIVLNAGVLHRVGPHRLHVKLARKAADLGIPALRIDLSGIGDSQSPRSDLSFRAQSVKDVQAAMDLLNKRLGVNKFILFGLCSGADNALATALADARVFAIALVDTICYVTPQARLRKLTSRLGELGGVREFAKWGLSRAAKALEDYANRSSAPSEVTPRTQQGREVPDKAEYEAQLRRLVDSGVQILALFSAAMGDNHNGPNQFFEVFPELKGRVASHYFPNANHTFTELDAQSRLLSTVGNWLTTVRPPRLLQP